MTLNRIVNINDMRLAAKRRQPRIAFDFIEGGVEGETCLARNEEAFRRHRLLPRYLLDVSHRSQSATLFGKTYDSPFGISPTGTAGLWRTGADDMLAQAAKAANIPFLLSCSSTGSIESVVRHAPGNTWFQLYGTRDRAIGRQMIERVRDLGVETLVVTVDVPVAPRRERNMRNGFTRPLRLRASTIIDGLRRPAWLIGYLRAGGGAPRMQNWATYAAPDATNDEVADVYAAQTPAPDHGWHDIEHYRRLWPGKLVIKGILHPEDAVRATALGADGIIVSNHGGRQLDLAPSPIEVLPAIREAVGPAQTLMIDSGVRRGSDVIVALCLGAQFVFFGRPTLYGVAAYGAPGAAKVIDIVRREIDINLAQLGCTDIAGLGPHVVMRPPDAYRISENSSITWHQAARTTATVRPS
jgi:(S)-mandelate dehydrogenase